jgi:hypothetical protein
MKLFSPSSSTELRRRPPCAPCLTPGWPLHLSGVLLFATVLSGCVTAPPPATVPLPPSLRVACTPAAVGALATQGDLDSLVMRQETALQVCKARHTAVVELVDMFNASVAPKNKWYEFWRK